MSDARRKASVKIRCKERDGHRCVISGYIEYAEKKRLEAAGTTVSGNNAPKLEVAHILSFSINQRSPNKNVI